MAKRYADPSNEQSAERWREALRHFMAVNGLEAAQWARQAGLPNPNAIYNFLHGRSKSLSLRTLTALAKAAGTSVGELTRESVRIAAPLDAARTATRTPRPRQLSPLMAHGAIGDPVQIAAQNLAQYGIDHRLSWMVQAAALLVETNAALEAARRGVADPGTGV